MLRFAKIDKNDSKNEPTPGDKEELDNNRVDASNATLVQGVQEIAQAIAERETGAESVMVDLRIKEVSAENADSTFLSEKAAILALLDSENETEYLDMSLWQKIDNNDETKITNVGQTGYAGVVGVRIPFNMTEMDTSKIRVLRCHENNGENEVTNFENITQSGAVADGTFVVDYNAEDSVKSTIVIYTDKFSTYAISYGELAKEEPHYHPVTTATRYDVFVAKNIENGEVTVSQKRASAGSTVTITVTADKGFTLETITVTDKSGKKIEVKDLGENKFSFRMPSSKVTVSATFMEDNSMLNFCVDVNASDYYYDAVLWAYENEICNGTDAVHFSPKAPVTRAQVVTFLWRAAGCPEPEGDASKFTDVFTEKYYAKAVAWAIEQGITKGTSETEFSPNATCTRGQIATFLARFAGVEDADTESVFGDVKATDYFAAAVKWAKDNGVTEGTTETTFSPNDDCTRAQVVTFLYRWMVK